MAKVNDAIEDAKLLAKHGAEVAELRRSFFDKLDKEGQPKPGKGTHYLSIYSQRNFNQPRLFCFRGKCSAYHIYSQNNTKSSVYIECTSKCFMYIIPESAVVMYCFIAIGHPN